MNISIFMSKLFSNIDVNDGRQIEWDYAKVFAIFAMIFVHFLAFCTFSQIDYGYVEEYLFILTQSSAPIFMFAMGIGMVYTRHDSTKEFIVRGIKLLLLGLVINTMYFLSNYAAGVPLEYSLLSFLANDILQFAGITVIVVGIFKKLGLSYTQMLLVGISLSLIVSYHPDVTLHNMYLNQLLGNFIETTGQNIVSCFPFLNWFIIPAAGMLFGNDLKRCNDKDKLYKLILMYTSITTIILLILGFITREGMFAITGGTVPEKLSYLHLSTQDIILLIVIILLAGSLFYFLSKRASPKINNFITRTSKNVTSIYLIQWALILSLTYINQFIDVESNMILRILTFLAVIIFSVVMAEGYQKIKSHIRRH